MFGYLQCTLESEKQQYQQYYCGLCHVLKHDYGNLSRLTLNHDLTFLAVLLTSLYEYESVHRDIRCVLHPRKKKRIVDNPAMHYAADMTILLSYLKLEDNVLDEHSKASALGCRLLKKAYQQVSARYPEKTKTIEDAIHAIHQLEAASQPDLDGLCAQTGKFLGTVFAMQNDMWSAYLYEIGDWLGRFIYLMDAYDDLIEDKEKHRFNPLIAYESRSDFEAWIKDILTMMIANAVRAIDKLPLFEETAIIENIVYEGVWYAYQKAFEKRNGGKNERSL